MSVSELLARLEVANAALRCRPPPPQGLTQRAALDEIATQLEAPALEALQRARQDGNVETAARLLGGLARYWWMRGRTKSIGVPEAEATMPLLLQHAKNTDISTSLRSAIDAALLGAFQLYYASADYRRAREAHAAVAAQDSGDALNLLGMAEREQGNLEAAERLHQRALTRYGADRDAWGEAHAVSNVGVCMTRAGHIEAAVAKHEEALRRRREIADTLGIASSLGNLALIYNGKRRDPGRAEALYVESLQMREALGDAWGVAGSCVSLALVKTSLKEPVAAGGYALRAFAAFASVGDQLGLAETCEAAAGVLEALGDAEGAVWSLGSAEGVRRRIDAPAASVATHLAHLAPTLSPERFEACRRAGAEQGGEGRVESVVSRLRLAMEKSVVRPRRAHFALDAATVALTIGVAVGVAVAAAVILRRWRR